MGTILIYYKYVVLRYPKRVQNWQQQICKDLGLTGRILIGHEGINGTVGGTDEATQQYAQIMRQNPEFADVEFKTSVGSAECFPRLQVLIKDEIVHLGVSPQECSAIDGGTHLTPAEWHALLQERPDDVVLLDTRNNYESRIGTFEGAIVPAIKNFRDLPGYLEQNIDLFRNKRVLMFCTAGVRCERATAYLKLRNVAKEVCQLEGGIHQYVEQFPDGFFRGKNYVFDKRIAVRVTDDVLSTCDLCDNASDEYQNCINLWCNEHYIGCTDCVTRLEYTCSVICHEKVTSGAVPVRPEPLRAWCPEGDSTTADETASCSL